MVVGLVAWAAPPAHAEHAGWRWLVDRLLADGVDRPTVERVFDDPRMGRFDGLAFSLHPREPHSLYRAFLRPRSVAAARSCRRAHAAALAEAERTWGVPASVVAAILHVESSCGRHTGSHPILPPLARLAMATEPETLRDNVARLAAGDAAVEVQVRARARYLDETFYPEVRAAFTLAARLGVDPLDLRGSEGGALGGPQFLPSHVLADGADGDHDGRVDVFNGDDAAASCACYLAHHGWRAGLSAAERRRVIWQYNRSDAYVDTILALGRQIDGSAPPLRTVRGPAPRPVAARKRRHSTVRRTGRAHRPGTASGKGRHRPA